MKIPEVDAICVSCGTDLKELDNLRKVAEAAETVSDACHKYHDHVPFGVLDVVAILRAALREWKERK